MSERTWSDLVEFFCQQDGIAFDDGPLTTALQPLEIQEGSGRGFYWARRNWWAEELLLPRVVAIAVCLEHARRAAGDPSPCNTADLISMHAGMGPSALARRPGAGDTLGWLRAAWDELDALTDRLRHTLSALAERDEQRRQVAALRGGRPQGTPTRAILEHLRRSHGPVADEDALRALLRDLDLHLLPEPWTHLDRATLQQDGHLRVTQRGRGKKSWRVGWQRLIRVAKQIGLLESAARSETRHSKNQ